MTALPGFPASSGLATFQHIRRALAGQVVQDSSGNLRTGILPYTTTALVNGTATMNVTVSKFVAVLDRNGAIFLANDGAVNVLLSSAPASGSRWSVVYVKQRESEAPFSDGADGPIIDKVESTTSATAARLLLPQGALELALVQVNAGSANTNAVGVTITQTYLYTAMSGGIVPVRDATELAAWTPGAGNLAVQLDTGDMFLRRQGNWIRYIDFPNFVARRAASAQATSGSLAAITGLSVVVDNGTWNHSNGVFTCVIPGRYNIDLGVSWAANATGIRYLRIISSLSITRAGKDVATAAIDAEAFASIWGQQWSNGDTFTIQQRQDSGGDLAVAAEVRIERLT